MIPRHSHNLSPILHFATCNGRFAIAFLLILSISLPTLAQPSAADIQRLALRARLEADQRDNHVRAIAAHLLAIADPAALARLEQPFADAFLLVADPPAISTLSPDTLEAVDSAIEAHLTTDDILAGRHSSLAYAYGFFNHDVTAAEITRAINRWNDTPDDDKRRLYPIYPHVIDALTKPLSVGPVGDRDDPSQTADALRAAIPHLLAATLAEPQPDAAFHPPTHAALVLAPIHDRWADDPTHGPLIRELLGDRQTFIDSLTSRLVAAQPDSDQLSPMELGFFAYTNQYMANALARLDARSTLPTLRASLELFESRGRRGATVAYLRRALMALGDGPARADFEATLSADPADPDSRALLVWLARNGRGETRDYALGHLARVYQTAPDDALDAHFRAQLRALGGD